MNITSLFIGSQEAAALLCISQITVQRLASAGALPVYRFARQFRFRREDVLRFAEHHRIAPARPDLYASSQD